MRDSGHNLKRAMRVQAAVDALFSVLIDVDIDIALDALASVNGGISARAAGTGCLSFARRR